MNDNKNDKLKMKFKLHGLEFELEGKEEVVKEEFEKFKSFITGDLLPNVNVITPNTSEGLKKDQSKELIEVQDVTPVEILDKPALKEVVLKDLPKSEREWILIYACYSTLFKEGTFTEENIKSQYKITRRKNKSRLANINNNIKILLKKDYIKVHNDTEYLIKSKGINCAHEILQRKPNSRSSKRTAKPLPSTKGSSSKKQAPKKKSFQKALTLDRTLNLRPEDKESLKAFAKKYQIDSTPKQIVVIVYYLREILGMTNISPNHIYTGLDELKIRIPKSLIDIISKTKYRNGWLDYQRMNDISLSVQGRNAIKLDLLNSK